ncbi:MAG: hypothetical protein KGY41_05035, partial [Desulfovermiculus sp.]|nr:hypothetical protein [Desulfovermiculus sp.]
VRALEAIGLCSGLRSGDQGCGQTFGCGHCCGLFSGQLKNIEGIDISYTSLFLAIDLLITACHVLTNKLHGLANGLLPKTKIIITLRQLT